MTKHRARPGHRTRPGEDRLTALSRIISHALRHAPGAYGLTLGPEGWVSLGRLMAALAAKDADWAGLAPADFAAMIAKSTKQRHEMRDGQIRAIYGHSVPGRLTYEPAPPPMQLYHGTSPEAATLILRGGLKPMRRQYVHLSPTIEIALEVGRRKSRQPVLLGVAAGDAAEAGIHFYRGNDVTWLADAVPARFIQRLTESEPERS